MSDARPLPPTTPIFVVEFSPIDTGEWREVPPAVRLRALIKAALRGYGLRVRRCREQEDAA